MMRRVHALAQSTLLGMMTASAATIASHLCTATHDTLLVPVCSDASFVLPRWTPEIGHVCGGVGCAPRGTRCPKAGAISTSDCNAGMASWHNETQTCAAAEDAVCALIEGNMEWGGTWGCVFPSQGCGNRSQSTTTTPMIPGLWSVHVDQDTSFDVIADTSSQLCSGTGMCNPQGTLCPTKGTLWSGMDACNESLPSWNTTINTCIVPADSVCTFRTHRNGTKISNIWQCEYQTSSSDEDKHNTSSITTHRLNTTHAPYPLITTTPAPTPDSTSPDTTTTAVPITTPSTTTPPSTTTATPSATTTATPTETPSPTTNPTPAPTPDSTSPDTTTTAVPITTPSTTTPPST
ncbi:hypothetical protein As57867_019142, partial [Aphanomyces stellatus]